MTKDEILAVLTGLFREFLDDPSIELHAADAEADIRGFDSGKKVLLILAVEERFGIRMRSREIDALKCIGDWLKLISAQRSLPGPSPGGVAPAALGTSEHG